jgi:tRNA pseudouridine38-40 synthase
VRLAVGLEYTGTAYAGWQRQHALPSVQAEVEQALSRVADHSVVTACAGRTDTGVHATGQVIHFDTPAVRPARGWLLGANRYLPPDISLNWIRPVADGFHARYAAMSRSYRYLILNSSVRSALWAGRACLWHTPLDAARMHESLQCLVGRHDFSAFRAAECQSVSTIRIMEAIRVVRQGPLLVLDVTANAFLHHMVRNIVGAALAVGEGVQPPGWIAALLAARDRTVAGITAPAAGLYFRSVRYPHGAGVPDGAGAGQSAIIGALPPHEGER